MSYLQVEIDDLKINYEVKGEGKPLIILHGWLANLHTMDPLTNFLANKFKVYAVDIVGFGESDLPNHPYCSNDFGDFLQKFVEKLQIENPILIGHSNGGRMIINCVGRGLIQARKIVLIDSAGLKRKYSLGHYVKVYTYKIVKSILNLFPKNEYFDKLRENLIGKFGSADYKNSPEVLRKTMSTILAEDLSDLLPNIKVPTLLIWGDQDTATPLEDGKKMEKKIPDAGLVVYKGAGHFSYLDKLGDCLIVLNEFLKQDY